MSLVVDTNILVDYCDIIFGNYRDSKLIMPACVLSELDKLKAKPTDVAYKARYAIKKIIQYKSDILFYMDEAYDPRIPKEWCLDGMNDTKILSCALKNNASLMTNDALLSIRADLLKVEVLEMGDKEEAIFTGVKEIYAEENEGMLARHYSNPEENVFGLFPNEYLIIYDYDYRNGEKIRKKRDRILRWDGCSFRELISVMGDIVEPMNDIQSCAIDLLFNRDIPIKIITGTYGSGKTMLTMKAAIYSVMGKNYYQSIYCVRNPVGVDEVDGVTSKGIGYLPGNKMDKIQDFFKPITQYLGEEEYTNKLLIDGTLKFDIPYFMKGVSIDNSFIIVEEAEDLNLKLLKLIGTRVGEGSVICFAGDIKQSENAYAKNNGLLMLINRTKNSSLAGCVMLNEDVRSSVSKLFACI